MTVTADTMNRAQFRTQLRARSDYGPAFITDAMLNDWINCSLQDWWDLIIQHDPTRIRKTVTIPVVSGTASYDLIGGVSPLAADYYRTKGVSVADASSPSGYATLDPYMWNERNDHVFGPTSSDKLFTWWHIEQGKLMLLPTPGWSGTILLEYFPEATLFTDDMAAISTVNGWITWVTWNVLCQCAIKHGDEFEFAAWDKERTKAEAGIRTASPQIKGAGPKCMTSVYDRSGTGMRRRPTRRW